MKIKQKEQVQWGINLNMKGWEHVFLWKAVLTVKRREIFKVFEYCFILEKAESDAWQFQLFSVFPIYCQKIKSTNNETFRYNKVQSKLGIISILSYLGPYPIGSIRALCKFPLWPHCRAWWLDRFYNGDHMKPPFHISNIFHIQSDPF